MDCIFCKIIAGEISSYKIYEDDFVLSFLDIAPINPGHTLVIPKKHIANMEDVDEKTLCQIMKVVKKIGEAIKNGLGVAGYNIFENNDPVAGQIVPHLHFHIVPRVEDDNLSTWPQRKYIEDEAEKVLAKIKNNVKL